MGSQLARDLNAATPIKFAPASPKDADCIWSALVEDTGAQVVLVDPRGVIEFAKQGVGMGAGVADQWAAEPVVGKSLAAAFGEDLGRERLGFVGQVIQSRQTLVVEGMCRGVQIRTTARPMLTSSGDVRGVMFVSRACAGMTPPFAGAPVIRSRVEDAGRLTGLTTRELDILKLIGIGLSTADIAKQLERSVKTVEWHRVSLGEKLGVTNRVELARIAIAAGLVSLDEPVGGSAGE